MMGRRDYYHDPAAPPPNRIVPAVTGAVIDSGHILLARRVDNDLWALPGGAIEVGETAHAAAVRETREETGLDIEIIGLLGVYSDPCHVIAYDDGEVRQQFSVCYSGRPIGGSLQPQPSEAREVAWIPVDRLGELPIHPAQRLRIDHGVTWKPGDPAHTS